MMPKTVVGDWAGNQRRQRQQKDDLPLAIYRVGQKTAYFGVLDVILQTASP
jgi:hypothetical protein